MTKAVFAIPGDKERRTGGFIYEARVLDALNEIGCPTAHLQLPNSFPDPSDADMEAALAALSRVPPDQPIILDGLVFGAIDPSGLAEVPAPVIAMIHHPLGLETGLPRDRAAFLLQNEAAALRHADHVIVPSSETARVLRSDFGAQGERITIVPPGFDRPRVHRGPLDPPLILSVGLLAPRKGHDVLLDALAQISDLPWQAEIVGKAHDPGYALALSAQTRDLGLQGRVRFLGELEADALTARFNAASIFALATRYEGYGMVLSEAMMYGLPIVSCDAGAVATTVGDAGTIVPVDDAAAFASALSDILTNPGTARALSRSAQEASLRLPSWHATARSFETVIDTLRG
ncbi:glycosyltransferase family 4 protein [Roseobacter sinensis]|uniref:Glycosyltransferase family 4 protein n=1 Tax=Roseobacter sinensis TaxID=2931391 RepID=A0ABT3BFF3_9RHOB|nr:glycosyltransferase family 4 protein [Roseobacter sp. WL0113]MCV3272316.1 glycosyltransferase family 4 protein [Roseobacter sp. WL0113]